MGDVADIERAMVSTLAGAFFPGGGYQSGAVTSGGAAGVAVKIYRGWPTAAELDADLIAGAAHVSVFPEPGMTRLVDPYDLQWFVPNTTPTTLTATVSGNVVTFGGTGGLGQVVGVAYGTTAGLSTVAYRLVANDTPSTVAAAVAALITGASAVGAVLTLPTTAPAAGFWNASDATSAVTLSNGGFTATAATNSGVGEGARGAIGLSSGRFYFEITAGAAMTSAKTVFMGIATPGAAIASSQQLTSGIVANSGGFNYALAFGGAAIGNTSASTVIVLNGTLAANAAGATVAAGHVIGVAVDLSAGLVWFRNLSQTGTAGQWNLNLNGNPAAGTGGISIAGMGFSTFFPVIAATNGTTGALGTLNAGASAFVGGVPAGFAGWSVPALIAQTVHARVVADSAALREVRRQVQGLRVSCWCPDADVRDTVAGLADMAFAGLLDSHGNPTEFITLPAGDTARVRYAASLTVDATTKDGPWRRDLRYQVEYGTTVLQTQPEMLFGSLGLTIPTAGAPASRIGIPY